jgi:hypothetical protein
MSTTPAATLVRRWVALYTSGMAPELRDARRAEINSDLWAQSDEADQIGRPPLSVGIEMLTRLALGIPADIGWRQSHRRGNVASSRKEITVREPGSHQVLTVIGAAWAALSLLFAAVLLIDIQGHHSDRPEDVWLASAATMTIIGGVVVALIGLLRIGRRPTEGRSMALIGATVAGGACLVALPWIWPIGIALALPLALIGLVRARQVMEAGPQQPA